MAGGFREGLRQAACFFRIKGRIFSAVKMISRVRYLALGLYRSVSDINLHPIPVKYSVGSGSN
jgi:hypothetical protein